MPRRPTHVLNLLLVPDDPDRAPDDAALADGLARLEALGALGADGRAGRSRSAALARRAGPRPEALIAGGFRRLLVDRPPLPRLYANRQGGAYVRCPSCDALLAPQAAEAVRRWRAGGDRGLVCPSCGAASVLESLRFRPPAAPARFALELRDVQSLETSPAAREALEIALGGGFVWVGSRG